MADTRELTLVVAVSDNGVIGREQTLPWKLRSDLQRFKKTTMGHGLIMGRKTFESIGRVLPGRTTVVLTRQGTLPWQGILVRHTLEDAIAALEPNQIPFVVGGAEIYRMALPLARRVLLTRVHATIEGDARFESLDAEAWECVSRENFPAGEQDEFATTLEDWRRTTA